MRSHTGVVLHVNQSDGNLYSWVAGDHDMSCHFEVYKSGAVEQYLDTDLTAWCQMAGNADYLSIETEGYDTEALTDAQVHTIASILHWANEVHGIALQLAEQPGQRGFGWHGMGGAAWGGHPDCPGVLRRNQRAQIIQLATETDMPLSAADLKAIDAIVETRVAKSAGFLAYGDGRGLPDAKNTHADANLQTLTHKIENIETKLGLTP